LQSRTAPETSRNIRAAHGSKEYQRERRGARNLSWQNIAVKFIDPVGEFSTGQITVTAAFIMKIELVGDLDRRALLVPSSVIIIMSNFPKLTAKPSAISALPMTTTIASSRYQPKVASQVRLPSHSHRADPNVG
jgi:hypothetical protein